MHRVPYQSFDLRDPTDCKYASIVDPLVSKNRCMGREKNATMLALIAHSNDKAVCPPFAGVLDNWRTHREIRKKGNTIESEKIRVTIC